MKEGTIKPGPVNPLPYDKIIYSICVGDVISIADEMKIGLTQDQLQKVCDKVSFAVSDWSEGVRQLIEEVE